jgi:hypothetical protein
VQLRQFLVQMAKPIPSQKIQFQEDAENNYFIQTPKGNRIPLPNLQASADKLKQSLPKSAFMDQIHFNWGIPMIEVQITDHWDSYAYNLEKWIKLSESIQEDIKENSMFQTIRQMYESMVKQHDQELEIHTLTKRVNELEVALVELEDLRKQVKN